MYYNNKKLALSILWVIIGAALIVLYIKGVLADSVYTGIGGGLIAVGALQIIKNLKYRNDSAYRAKIDLAASDERNTFIRTKSMSITARITIFADGIGSLIAAFFGNKMLQLVLAYHLLAMIIIYLITMAIIEKKN